MSELMPPDDFLKHYGVKGMKWGVINEDRPKGRRPSGKSDAGKSDSSGKSDAPAKSNSKFDEASSAKKFAAIAAKAPKKSQKESIEALAENKKKSLAKVGATPQSVFQAKHGFRPTKKQVGFALLGAAAAGLIIYNVQSGKSLSDLSQLASSVKPGDKVEAQLFNHLVHQSVIKSWGGKYEYIHPSSFHQGEFVLPKGHVFHRLSTAAEDSFKGATYATHSIEDFSRYVANFRHELNGSQLHHITFSATEDIKVPSLAMRLETLGEVLRRQIPTVSDDFVLNSYKNMTGGSWESQTAKDFFKALADKGYHAIVDDMDAGVIGESPLVIFRSDAMTSKVVKKFTAGDIKAAEEALFELANRKL